MRIRVDEKPFFELLPRGDDSKTDLGLPISKSVGDANVVDHLSYKRTHWSHTRALRGTRNAAMALMQRQQELEVEIANPELAKNEKLKEAITNELRRVSIAVTCLCVRDYFLTDSLLEQVKELREICGRGAMEALVTNEGVCCEGPASEYGR